MKTTRKPYVAVVTRTIVNKTVFNLGNWIKIDISHNVYQGISIKDGGYDGGVLFSSYSP